MASADKDKLLSIRLLLGHKRQLFGLLKMFHQKVNGKALGTGVLLHEMGAGGQ